MTGAWPFGPTFDALPTLLPIFPLRGVLLLPGGRLPLNVFEPRYLAMFDDAMRGDRLIGMIQPSRDAENRTESRAERPAVFSTGCAGRIISFDETEDGRYQVTLAGMCRFHPGEEAPLLHGYRRMIPDWTPFRADMEEGSEQPSTPSTIDRERFVALLQSYFHKQGLSADWQAIEAAAEEHLLTCLAMICPFSACEKQALLEAPTQRDRGQIMLKLLAMAVAEGDEPDLARH